jgi:hypothetical protein
MFKASRFVVIVLICLAALAGCQQYQIPEQAYTVYFVSPGGATTGSVYPTGDTVYVPGAGNLTKSGFSLAGWNTMDDGSGLSYAAGATFTMGSADMSLYAVWIPDNLQFAASGTSIDITLCGSAPTPSLVIPGGVTGIASEAFFDVQGITSVTIPASVTNIGFNAFYGCAKLASVTVQATTPPFLPDSSNAFGTPPVAGLQIAVPAASVSKYQSAAGWTSYTIVSM